MKNGLVLLVIALFLSSCDIKNSDAKVEVEEGTQVEEPAAPETTVTATHPVEVKNPDKEEITKETPTPPGTNADLLGYWVGYFKKDIEDPNYEKNIESDAGFYWNRANKINISIDQ
ncbi:MAG: YARHG domain-containing protein, partial [Bacteroidota bacterium]